MHQRVCWRAIAVKELTRCERQRAQEGLMLITRKKSGDVKSRLAYNGKPTRGWIKDEDKPLPTVLTESLFVTCAIDSHEERDVMIMDIPNAFIQASIPKREKGDRIVMKIRGRLVDWLVEISPETYFHQSMKYSWTKLYKIINDQPKPIIFSYNHISCCIAQRRL